MWKLILLTALTWLLIRVRGLSSTLAPVSDNVIHSTQPKLYRSTATNHPGLTMPYMSIAPGVRALLATSGGGTFKSQSFVQRSYIAVMPSMGNPAAISVNGRHCNL